MPYTDATGQVSSLKITLNELMRDVIAIANFLQQPVRQWHILNFRGN